MTITSEQYEEALKVVAAKETGYLEELHVVLTNLKQAINQNHTEISEIKDEVMNVTSTGPTGIRAIIEQYTGQIRSFADQTEYMLQTVQSQLNQYNLGPQTLPLLP